MNTISKEFTLSQLELLSILDAFGEPVSIDILGALLPLSPNQLFDQIAYCGKAGVIEHKEDRTVSLVFNISEAIRTKLKDINSVSRLSDLYHQLDRMNLLERLETTSLIRLLSGAREDYDAAFLVRHALENIDNGMDIGLAMKQLRLIVERLSKVSGSPPYDRLYITSTLGLSQLCIRQGTGFNEIVKHLQNAKRRAKKMGDNRSLAMIGLHLGRYFFLSVRLSDCLKDLESSLDMVKRLGDEDILNRSTEFFGLYHYIKGEYQQASIFYERAMRQSESWGDHFQTFPVPITFGHCALMSGQFHRALGVLDSHRRHWQKKSEPALATKARAILALALLMTGRRKEALAHINVARNEFKPLHNVYLTAFVDLFYSYYCFLESNLSEAYQIIRETMESVREAKIDIQQYPTAWLLEMLFEFERMGYTSIPGLDYQQELRKALQGPNVHLMGVALRLQVKERSLKNQDAPRIRLKLLQSVDYLKRSGDPIELAKTYVELARSDLKQNNREEAAKMALKAWEGMSGFGGHLFPDDLKFLLDYHQENRYERRSMEEMVDRAFEMTRSLYRHSTIDNMLERLVEAVSEFLRAERGGLFWFANGETQKPELKVTRNLMREEIFSDEFKDSLALVMESFQKSIPILCFQKDTEANPLKASKRPVICVPVTIGKSARGVLFHDNIHLNNDVDLLNEALLMKLSHYISQHIDYISMYSQQDTIKPNHGDVYQSASNTGDHEIITRHPGFLKELKTLDKIADSKATVLITGETGTGKELIARRVHQMSPRITEPFIVVDLTSISPNLVESELFGHEKGSFTGADRQKIGRFELAHRGTLFIDELGDIPLSIQVKLLRVFQERTFVRVGGVQTIHSDFRLVAATNRNLEKEMSAGRFREDLYYRLNVVPVTIPPLRERGCDIIFLAKWFLDYFTRKFNRPRIELTTEDTKALMDYKWPGNVRELKNVIERYALMADEAGVKAFLPLNPKSSPDNLLSDNPDLDELQRRYITLMLDRSNGRIGGPGGAAKLLGMKRTSLYARMRKLGM